MSMWNGFSWLTMGYGGGSCEDGKELSICITRGKCLGWLIVSNYQLHTHTGTRHYERSYFMSYFMQRSSVTSKITKNPLRNDGSWSYVNATHITHLVITLVQKPRIMHILVCFHLRHLVLRVTCLRSDTVSSSRGKLWGEHVSSGCSVQLVPHIHNTFWLPKPIYVKSKLWLYSRQSRQAVFGASTLKFHSYASLHELYKINAQRWFQYDRLHFLSEKILYRLLQNWNSRVPIIRPKRDRRTVR
jgi:hypothetical protein